MYESDRQFDRRYVAYSEQVPSGADPPMQNLAEQRHRCRASLRSLRKCESNQSRSEYAEEEHRAGEYRERGGGRRTPA
jgi:hypothetical protein